MLFETRKFAFKNSEKFKMFEGLTIFHKNLSQNNSVRKVLLCSGEPITIYVYIYYIMCIMSKTKLDIIELIDDVMI